MKKEGAILYAWCSYKHLNNNDNNVARNTHKEALLSGSKHVFTSFSSTGHMCSFDVVSLFTNVPLEETIDICADALYRRDDNKDPVAISEDSFRKLLKMVRAVFLRLEHYSAPC